MAKQTFGGDWTEDKLERVRKYLCAYTKIFARNPRARCFTTTYVDAFAGEGKRIDPKTMQDDPTLFFDEGPDIDRDMFKKGSARIALEVNPPFDHYLFIESSDGRVRELRRMVDEYDDRKTQVHRGEANEALRDWCASTDWRMHRAVVFLDPFGMQVEWETVEAIARTKAIDLWWLFPLGIGVSRLLTRSEPPPAHWAKRLTSTLGTEEWREAFYRVKEDETLFGPDVAERREANHVAIAAFVVSRLRKVFAKVAENPLHLRNSRGTPIYLLCFAAGNPKGASTAVRIAQYILKQ